MFKLADVLSQVAGYFAHLVEGWTGLYLAQELWTKEYEKLSLEDIVKRFVPEGPEQDELISLLRTDTRMRRSVLFVEFLKRFNLDMSKASIKMSILNRDWGNITSRLMNAISWSYGFGWLSWIGLSPILNSLVARPSEEALNETFPQRALTYSQVVRLLREGKISEDEARDRLHKLGYSDEEVNLLISFAQAEEEQKERELTKSELIQTYVEGLASWKWVESKLREMGYTDVAINALKKLADHRRSSKFETKERDMTTSQILRALKLGIISESDARRRLTDLGYSDDEISILIETALYEEDEESTKEEKALTKTDILKAFKEDVITEEEARSMLKALGYADANIEILMTIAKKAKEPVKKEKERDLTKTPILKAFRIGMITREEAKGMLMDVGYSEAEAEFLLKVEEADMQADKHERERDLTKSEILTLFEYGLLDEYTTKEKLKALGYDDEEAEALITLRLIKLYERAKSESASS